MKLLSLCCCASVLKQLLCPLTLLVSVFTMTFESCEFHLKPKWSPFQVMPSLCTAVQIRRLLRNQAFQVNAHYIWEDAHGSPRTDVCMANPLPRQIGRLADLRNTWLMNIVPYSILCAIIKY